MNLPFSFFIKPSRIQLLTILTVLGAGFTTPAICAPYDIPQDTASAANIPDEYAWKLFVAINWPADTARRAANPSAKFGADGPVVWETWKNARGEVFRSDGRDPGEWLDQQVAVARNLTDFDTRPLQQIARDRQLGNLQPAFDPAAALRGINETRLNKEAYEFVRSKTLYNLEGQNALAKAGELTLTFPLAGKEIKAQWRLITEAEKSRYHWATMRMPDNTTGIFGLTALHITTKDLPNWFWATFEHVDNPTRPGNEPWRLESRDRFACSTAPYNCNLAPQGIGLQGTKWEFYRLRGTQTDFVDSRGNITLLANSQPEQGFQQTSSCITCHSRSAISANGDDRPDIFRPDGQSFNGTPDPAWFITRDANGKQTGRYTQLDFVWSLFRARPKQ
jgi:hypothetical protein